MKYRILLFVLSIALFLAGCGASDQQSGNNASSGNEGSSMDSSVPPADQAGGKTADAVRIGTSSAGGNFYTLTAGMAEIMSKHTSINTSVEPVGGSDANISALQENFVQLAMVNSSSAFNGYYGHGAFEGDPVDVFLVAQGQDSFRQIVVRDASGINGFEDFKGKKFIASRPSLPELEEIAAALFQVYGVPLNEVDIISTVNTPEALDALKIGSVDAAIIPGGVAPAELVELFSSGDFRLLTIPDDKLKEVLEILPKIYQTGTISKEKYKGQEQDVTALKFNTYLAANAQTSEQTVYELLKALMDNYEEYAATHNLAKRWTLENTMTDPKIPYHPGAVKYFKEIGKWTDELEKTQQSLQR